MDSISFTNGTKIPVEAIYNSIQESTLKSALSSSQVKKIKITKKYHSMKLEQINKVNLQAETQHEELREKVEELRSKVKNMIRSVLKELN